MTQRITIQDRMQSATGGTIGFELHRNLSARSLSAIVLAVVRRITALPPNAAVREAHRMGWKAFDAGQSFDTCIVADNARQTAWREGWMLGHQCEKAW